tara:strand:- start:134 stop:361 length:228 start_codon:yes stop_codon:yes gene_type:complete
MEWTEVSKKLPEYNKLVLVIWNDHNNERRQSVASVSSITRHGGENPPMDDRWWIDCSRAEIRKPIYWTDLDMTHM